MNRIILAGLLVLIPMAFTLPVQQHTRRPAEIIIHNADSAVGPYAGQPRDVMRLFGNLSLQHEDVMMACDSAHRYANSNIIHAFGNVHINQGDTLHLYADRINYHGNRRYAEARGNVRLIDNETTLTTEYLDFDIGSNYGYFPNRAVVINGDNRLESIRGYYYTREKIFFFQDSVHITNPDYIIRSDALRYNTVSEVAYFLGPTTIIGDGTDIYCENGWYNTQTDIAQFNENARVRNNNQVLLADSIFFDNRNGTGEGFMNIEITDTVEKIIIRGNYARFERDPEQMLITDRALFIQMMDNDTIYLHADTLRSWLQVDYISQPDTLDQSPEQQKPDISEPPDDPDPGEPGDRTDRSEEFADEYRQEPETDIPERQEHDPLGISPPDTIAGMEQEPGTHAGQQDTIRMLSAYYSVRFFGNEIQGKCDSLFYNMRDSVIYMFAEPVIWSDGSQLTAEFMEVHSRNGEVDHIIMKRSAFIVSHEQDDMYNQIKGTDIVGFIREGDLYRVNVSGNAETLYYPLDNNEIIGINRIVSASMVIFLEENKPSRIRWLTNADATLYPVDKLPPQERILQGFQWLDQLRPKSRDDVFINK
jgi:lipopolysaccharide export system protein LptA